MRPALPAAHVQVLAREAPDLHILLAGAPMRLQCGRRPAPACARQGTRAQRPAAEAAVGRYTLRLTLARARARQGYEASKNDQPIQVTPGVYNEVALQRYDLLLAEAARNGIRLILSLSNWWDEQGGVRRAAPPRRYWQTQPPRHAAVPWVPWVEDGLRRCARHGVQHGCCDLGCDDMSHLQCALRRCCVVKASVVSAT